MRSVQSARLTAGFSLIEFMVATTLGLILISGAVTVYLATKRSYTEVEQSAELAENSRFAMQVLNESLRHTGFFGGAKPRDVVPDIALGSVASNCTGVAAAYRVGDYLIAATADGSGNAFGCVDDAVPGTDVLVIKHVLPRPLYDADPDNPSASRDGVISFPSGLDNNEVYVIANSERGVILDRNGTPPDLLAGSQYALAAAWPYRMQVFYIRDLAVPTLSRKRLEWNTATSQMALVSEDLVPGAERLRFRFGLDSDNDGDVDTYVNLASAAIAGRWDRVESLEVSLLLRSQTEDIGYTDPRTYVLGDLTLTPGGSWRRQLVRTNVSLRNPKLNIRGAL